MDDLFEIISGLVIGKDHYQVKRNAQDAVFIKIGPRATLVLVADGCGESSNGHNEVGAKIGVRLVAMTIERLLSRLDQKGIQDSYWISFFERVRQDVLARIRLLALEMGESLTEVVSNYFLFTIVGVLITDTVSVFFNLGDGYMFVNGEEIKIGPFPDNKPPYLAYGLFDPGRIDVHADLLCFKIQKVLPTDNLENFLVGTDGLSDLIRAQNTILPARGTPVGIISQLWEEDRFFVGQFALQRFLNILNNATSMIDWANQRVDKFHGFLSDDTALAVGRRKR